MPSNLTALGKEVGSKVGVGVNCSGSGVIVMVGCKVEVGELIGAGVLFMASFGTNTASSGGLSA